MAAESRHFEPVKRGTHMHAILDILKGERLTAAEVADRMPDEFEDTTGTTGARRAWNLKYAEREKDYERKGNPYVYRLNDTGKEETEKLGPYPPSE